MATLNFHSVFEYRDYREFLIQILGGPNKRTGQRGALSKHLGCQTAYLSQVLGGVANLNLEQAFQVNVFLGHDSQAAEFFLLLVQKERAGSFELKNYFQNKIDEILKHREDIKSRVKTEQSLSDEDHAKYYSNWYFSAIHVAISIPDLQTPQALSRHFLLKESLVQEVMEFLVSRGMAVLEKGRYHVGPSHIHLSKNSPFIQQLHSNWRLQSIQAMGKHQGEDLHYSVVYSLSKKDVEKIKQQILDVIEKNMAVVKPSKEEVLYCHTVDFFELKG